MPGKNAIARADCSGPRGIDRRSDMPHKTFTGRAAGFFQPTMKLLHFFGSLAKKIIF
jgi:hypothetical protein